MLDFDVEDMGLELQWIVRVKVVKGVIQLGKIMVEGVEFKMMELGKEVEGLVMGFIEKERFLDVQKEWKEFFKLFGQGYYDIILLFFIMMLGSYEVMQG